MNCTCGQEKGENLNHFCYKEVNMSHLVNHLRVIALDNIYWIIHTLLIIMLVKVVVLAVVVVAAAEVVIVLIVVLVIL